MGKERQIFVYYIDIKNKETDHYLPPNEIKEELEKIKDFEYIKGADKSILRYLGTQWYGIDIIPNGNSDSFVMKGSRVRDGDNLPTARSSKTEWIKLTTPKGADLLEVSYGVFYFPKELKSGCFLFLLYNHHGMAITKVLDYIKSLNSDLRPIKTIMSEPNQLKTTLDSLQDIRYVLLDNKRILPAPNEDIGDYYDRKKHPDEHKSRYNAKRIIIDVRNQAISKMELIRNLIRDFRGKEITEDKDIQEFIATSNMRLIGVQEGCKKQASKPIDLTKTLYAFTYTIENSFDESEFYSFCDEKFNNPRIRGELINIATGVSQITEVNNNV